MTKLVVLQKATNYKSRLQRLMDRRGESMSDVQLEKFRKLILDHLSTLDDDEPEEGTAIKKAFSKMILLLKSGLPVGTIHTYRNGKKYIKSPSGKWIPKYDSHTRGAKMAISAIKRKIAAAPDAHTMMQIILENRDRFSDKNGQPLPFVQDLSKYVSERGNAIEAATKKDKKQRKPQGKDMGKKTRGVKDFSLGWGEMGNGTTVWNRKKEIDGDYETLAHIEDDGTVQYRSTDIPAEIKAEIENHAAYLQKKNSGKAGKSARPKGEDGEGQGKKDSEWEKQKSKRAKAALERVPKEYERGAMNASAAISNLTLAGVDEKTARRAIGIPDSFIDEAWRWDKENKKRKEDTHNSSEAGKAVQPIGEDGGGQEKTPGKDNQDKLARNPGEMYIDASIENPEKFAVRVVSKDGNDGYVNASGGNGIERMFGGPAEFDTKEEAQKWIDDHPKKPKKEVVLSKENKSWIDRNINGEVDKKGYLLEKDENGRVTGKIKLAGLILEYYNTVKKTDSGKSDFEKIKDKYQSAKSFEGDDDQIQVGKELISGKWKLVEADTPTASHDETNFHKTPGFPTTDDGATINDRDYGHDREAQEIVMEIGSDYDGRAVSVDNPVIITKDGIVISGNNRTMSSKIAARKGTDKGYIEALKRKAKKFGFTPEQVDKFKHPRVVFETAENKGYSTDQFAKFNKSSKKAMSPVEAAVKVSKTIKMDTVESIAGKMIDFETLGELYADRNVVNDIFNTLQRDNIITSMDRPQYVVDGGITGAGKEFLETILIGSVINESNIRGLNREGCKSIRQKLVRAITPLIENKGMDGYSVTKELNEAVDIAMQIAVQKDKFKSVDDYASQKNLFGIEDDPVSVELARKLEGTQKEFAAFMQSMNGGLKYAANGEADIFLGNVESREDILARMLNLKKAINNVIDLFRNLRAGKGPRFIKKAVPIQGRNGETELSERWMQESIEGIAPYVEEAGVSNIGAKVVAVDFDGVINSYISGWEGSTETDAPVLSAAESLKTFYERGYKVIIFSTRANTQEGIDTIREYLRKHTENNELADTIEITNQKPIADMYIDDRAIPFNGDWEETLKRIEEFKPWTEKSLTWSGYPLQGRTKIHGMDISIENKKGSTRSGTDKNGTSWSQKMGWDYGYIRGTVGKDKDHVDCFVGPNPESEKVFVIHQVDPFIDGHPFDEDKVMLGWDNAKDAKIAYLEQYNRPDFFGSMDEMDIETFKEKAFDPKNKGKKLRG